MYVKHNTKKKSKLHTLGHIIVLRCNFMHICFNLNIQYVIIYSERVRIERVSTSCADTVCIYHWVMRQECIFRECHVFTENV